MVSGDILRNSASLRRNSVSRPSYLKSSWKIVVNPSRSRFGISDGTDKSAI